jgi:hypothetical protein
MATDANTTFLQLSVDAGAAVATVRTERGSHMDEQPVVIACAL